MRYSNYLMAAAVAGLATAAATGVAWTQAAAPAPAAPAAPSTSEDGAAALNLRKRGC